MPPKKTTVTTETTETVSATTPVAMESVGKKTATASNTKKASPVKKSQTSLPHAPSLDTKLFQPDNIKLIRALEKMTKTLEKLAKDQEEFNSNFSELSNYTEDEMNEMDYKLRLKNEECYNYLTQLNKAYTEKQFALDNEFNERKYALETKYKQLEQDLEMAYVDATVSKLTGILQDKYNRVVVDSFDYNEQQRELSNLRKQQDEFRKEMQAQMHKELNARLETSKLQHQLETSTMQATIENQKREIEVLRNTISDLKGEVQAQRELTEKVANASQKQLTQNFGK